MDTTPTSTSAWSCSGNMMTTSTDGSAWCVRARARMPVCGLFFLPLCLSLLAARAPPFTPPRTSLSLPATLPTCHTSSDPRSSACAQTEFCELVIDLARHEQHAWLSEPCLPTSDVRAAFELGDANGSGYLDYVQLQRALRDFGYDASIDESIDLLRQYDDRFEGRLDLPSFAALVDDLVLASHGGWRLGGALSSDGALPLPPARYIPRFFPAAAVPQRPYVPAVPTPAFTPSPVAVQHVQHVPFGGRMVPVAPSLARSASAAALAAAGLAADSFPSSPRVPSPSAARMSYVRPLASASVRLAFERFDEARHGVLDTLRCRDALIFLGARLSHGEVASLLRRYGGYVPEFVDAVCSLPQFGAIVNHLRDVGMPVANPFLASAAHHSDIQPHALGAQAASGTHAATEAPPPPSPSVGSAQRWHAQRWHGFVPHAGRPGSAPIDFSFRPRISPASGRPSLHYPL